MLNKANLIFLFKHKLKILLVFIRQQNEYCVLHYNLWVFTAIILTDEGHILAIFAHSLATSATR